MTDILKQIPALVIAESKLSPEERDLFRNYKLHYADLVLEAGDQAYELEIRETINIEAEKAFPGGTKILEKVLKVAEKITSAGQG